MKANSVLKKIILIFLGIIVTLVLAAGGIAVWVFNNPIKALQLAQEHVLPEDLDIEWEGLEINPKYEGGLNFSLSILAKNLLIKKQTPLVRIPVQLFEMDATFYFSSSKNHELRRLSVIADQEIFFQPGPKDESEEQQSLYQQSQNAIEAIQTLKETSIEELLVELPKIKIGSVDGILLSVNLKKDDINAKINLDSKITKGSDLSVDIKASLFGDQSLIKSNIDLTSAAVDSVVELDLSTKAEETVHVNASGDVKLKQGRPIHFNPTLKLTLTEDLIQLDLSTDARGRFGPLREFKDIRVRAEIPQTNNVLWSEDSSKTNVASSLDLIFIDKALKAQIEKSCACQLPMSLGININGEVWLSRIMAPTENLSPVVNATVKLDEVSNKLFDIALEAKMTIEKEGHAYSFLPTLDSNIHIHSFQAVTKILEANKILIPTPFNVLDGEIKILSKGNAEATSQFSEIPIEVSIDLSSPQQKVQMTSQSKLSLHRSLRRADVEIAADIQAIELTLPPLDPIRGTPRVVKDARILKTPKEDSKSGFTLNLDFSIRTMQDGAIKLYHEYFKPYLPITLNLNSKPNAASFLRTEPFDVVYLRRKVTVNKMNLNLSQTDKDVIPVDAQLQVNQTQYRVFIDVKGNLKEPQVILSSEPDLSEDDIVSVLLYDQPRSDLGAGEAENSAGVQSAIADKAIGLFGLWAFASTPIKRFSYNPVTKVYSAAIEVSDSVTAEIGTNWEEATNLEVHKRLSRRWVLTAAWTPATTDAKETQKLMLQWEKRF